MLGLGCQASLCIRAVPKGKGGHHRVLGALALSMRGLLLTPQPLRVGVQL